MAQPRITTVAVVGAITAAIAWATTAQAITDAQANTICGWLRDPA